MTTSLQATPQIEADKGLIQFKTFEEYLDSLATTEDHCYLQSVSTVRTIVELGYRTSGETLTKKRFEKRRAAVLQYLYPTVVPYTLAAMGAKCASAFEKELALREHANRLGIMGTIIFLKLHTKAGYEISGYIDYAHSLTQRDWRPIFRREKKLIPKRGDLGYYHWRMNVYAYNDTPNYKAVVDPYKGLMFQNRYDRKNVCVDPSQIPGYNSNRSRLISDLYDTVVLYDHIIMQRI